MADAVTGELLTRELIGREQPCRSLAAFLAGENDIPSLLLAGPESSGKRTIAIRFAQAANCPAEDRPCGECRSCRTIAALNHPDIRLVFPPRGTRKSRKARENDEEVDSKTAQIIEETPDYALAQRAPILDPTRRIPIEAIRSIRQEMSRPPFTATRRFFIVVHAERMTPEAANAFLKTLEEPQRQTTLILTTSSPSMLPDTIRSRCRFIRFPAVPSEQIRTWLEQTCSINPADAASAAEIATGSPGRALRFLDNPEEYLAPAVVKFFCQTKIEDSQVFEAIQELKNTSLTTVTGSFLFLFDQALKARHGLPTCYAESNPALLKRADAMTDDYLRRVIRYLTERLDETRLNINPRLFLYTILASLRRP